MLSLQSFTGHESYCSLLLPWLQHGYLLHQRVWDGFGEGGEGTMDARALPVEDAYRQQRHTGALAVEGQVEPRPPQRLQAQQFDIGAPHGAAPQ